MNFPSSSKKYGHFYQLLYTLIFTLTWLFISFSSGNADYDSYKLAYDSLSEYSDIGYSILVSIFHYLGIKYQIFLSFFSLVALSLLSSTIKKFTDKPIWVFALYIIFPFFFDIVQIRNFMALSIMIFALRYLVEFSWKNFSLYILSIAVASTFHTVALVYILFVICYMEHYKTVANISVWLAVIGSIMVSFLSRLVQNPLIASFISSFNPRILYYISDISLDNNTILLYVLYVLIPCFLSYRLYYKYEKKQEQYNTTFTNDRFFTMLSKVCILSLAFIPIIIIDPTLFRVFRNVIVCFYLLFYSNLYFEGRISGVKIIFYRIAITTYSVLSFVNFLLLDEKMYNSVTHPNLYNNLFFNSTSGLFTFLILSFVVILALNFYVGDND